MHSVHHIFNFTITRPIHVLVYIHSCPPEHIELLRIESGGLEDSFSRHAGVCSKYFWPSESCLQSIANTSLSVPVAGDTPLWSWWRLLLTLCEPSTLLSSKKVLSIRSTLSLFDKVGFNSTFGLSAGKFCLPWISFVSNDMATPVQEQEVHINDIHVHPLHTCTPQQRIPHSCKCRLSSSTYIRTTMSICELVYIY